MNAYARHVRYTWGDTDEDSGAIELAISGTLPEMEGTGPIATVVADAAATSIALGVALNHLETSSECDPECEAASAAKVCMLHLVQHYMRIMAPEDVPLMHNAPEAFQ